MTVIIFEVFNKFHDIHPQRLVVAWYHVMNGKFEIRRSVLSSVSIIDTPDVIYQNICQLLDRHCLTSSNLFTKEKLFALLYTAHIRI